MAELENASYVAGKHVRYATEIASSKIINLLTDLKEERDLLIENGWVTYPMMKIVNDFEESLKKSPPIRMGTPDPYQPSN